MDEIGEKHNFHPYSTGKSSVTWPYLPARVVGKFSFYLNSLQFNSVTMEDVGDNHQASHTEKRMFCFTCKFFKIGIVVPHF